MRDLLLRVLPPLPTLPLPNASCADTHVVGWVVEWLMKLTASLDRCMLFGLGTGVGHARAAASITPSTTPLPSQRCLPEAYSPIYQE